MRDFSSDPSRPLLGILGLEMHVGDGDIYRANGGVLHVESSIFLDGGGHQVAMIAFGRHKRDNSSWQRLTVKKNLPLNLGCIAASRNHGQGKKDKQGPEDIACTFHLETH